MVAWKCINSAQDTKIIGMLNEMSYIDILENT